MQPRETLIQRFMPKQTNIDWEVAKSLEIMRQEPIADEERAKKWTNDMLAVCEKKLELLKKSDPAKLKPKDLQLMSQVLRTIDDLTRRTLRLDEPTSQKGAFTVVVLDNSTPSTHVCLNDIVEDTEPIASPARVLERLQD